MAVSLKEFVRARLPGFPDLSAQSFTWFHGVYREYNSLQGVYRVYRVYYREFTCAQLPSFFMTEYMLAAFGAMLTCYVRSPCCYIDANQLV